MRAATVRTRPPRKPDRSVALTLSVLPGLGQLYNRQPRKAAYFTGWTVFCLVSAILLITQGERLGHDLLAGHSGALFLLVALVSVLLFLGLFIAGLFLWASAAVDAWHSAVAIGEGRSDDAERRRLFRL